ncbi:ATP-dependent DNA ligase [Bacillus chungangensis]|uniref:DNA ligase-1 n=1 Tax=Bacillus chungangensis TaxID=587633 RepID=A0ABT9WNP5_9BACI|nr:RNA ligase family protein [Bacillus chungangensis]MDQ0174405.1 DNA ligase-1 [Bacillus chungangensis]
MFISPMLLRKSEEPFDDSRYLTELKLDGIRFIYSVGEDGKVRMYTRHKNEVTTRFPELKALSLPPGTVLDGELIATDNEGKPDFEAVMSRFMSRKSVTPVSYVVFDVLQYEGKLTIQLPLLVRKELLAEIVPTDTPLLSKVQFIEGNGSAYYDAVKEQALEGIVLKRKDSRYEIGKRSANWLKVVNYQFADVLVTGWRKAEFGWSLKFADSGEYAGAMELGVPAEAKRRVYSLTVAYETKDFAYLEQPFAVRVKYRNLTKAGLLRLPSFVSWADPH